MRILIIDDEENIRRITAMALEGMGHEAAVAEDGDTALRQLAAERFRRGPAGFEIAGRKRD